MSRDDDSLLLAAKRNFGFIFGSGLFLIAITLFLHSKTVMDVLTLAGMGFQSWGIIVLWNSQSRPQKTLTDLNAGH